MGKCKFNEAWRDKRAFHWVKPVENNVFEAFCTVCKKKIQLGTMGVKALESHAKSAKHISSMKVKDQTPSVAGVFQPANVSQLADNVSEVAGNVNQPAANVTATALPATSATPVSVDLRTAFGSTPTMKAEVLWTLNTVAKHQSYNSNENVSDLFKFMFPDSDIATTFTCGPDKTAYIAKFGLAVFIKEELVSKVNKSPFVLMFDESLNETTKNKQLDVHVRFWDEGQVQSRYLGSRFMGHSTAQDLLSHLKECMDKLNLKDLVSISMDGPSVNWKLFELFQKDQAEQYGGLQLICVGSCGLHTLHNAFKCGFTAWLLDKLLRAMHTLFNNVPARREDYVTVTKSSVFPLSFCAHRWVENLPVVERALVVWPSLLLYMEAVKTKKLPNPGTGSYDTVAAAIKDPLILAKFHFYAALARTFTPFLTKYQTDEPVLPFLSKDLTELMISLLRRFIKREVLNDITALQLTKLDVTDKTIWLSPQNISIGLGDVILQQFDSLLSLESRSEDFLYFAPMQKRLDIFLSSAMEPYPELWAFCKKLLILSHGQATVERGFSINKEVESDNLHEDTVVTRRLVCDYIIQHGGVTKVPLSKPLLTSVARARTRYRIHLENERKKREAKDQALKRKEAEDCLQELKVKRIRVKEVSEGLARDADRLAEQAEAKAGSKMADLISRSNLLRRGHKEKLAELVLLDKEIAAKSEELRS
ncbi:uncharacterized protein LOC134871567 isoform X2 [Eleginops maclovinus]|uniref:uncharacterized protein LOC134871567 isoform X2 n=1 Tax=Eleginops maclovinus TaxID=56733 RepID=UPI00308102FF